MVNRSEKKPERSGRAVCELWARTLISGLGFVCLSFHQMGSKLITGNACQASCNRFYLLSQSIIWPEYAPPTIRFGWNMENLATFGQRGTQCLLNWYLAVTRGDSLVKTYSGVSRLYFKFQTRHTPWIERKIDCQVCSLYSHICTT